MVILYQPEFFGSAISRIMKLRQVSNFKDTSLLWVITNQIYCTLIIILPDVCAGFVASSIFPDLFLELGIREMNFLSYFCFCFFLFLVFSVVF